MNQKLIKKVVFFIVLPLLLISFYTFSSIPKAPFKSYNYEGGLLFKNIFTNANVENTLLNSESKENEIKLLGSATISSKSNDLELYPGGSSIGIKISTKGVLVVGFSDVETEKGLVGSPSRDGGIELGDTLLKVNNEDIENSKDLIRKLNNNSSQNINLSVERNGSILTKTIIGIKNNRDDNFKIGLWVRDSTAGVGTLTFYDGNSGKFGALGHPITDCDTNTRLSVKDGRLVSSSIISVRKGQRGTPGELKGVFLEEDNPLGKIESNTISGVFGTTSRDLSSNLFKKPLKVGFKDEIKEGKAQIVSTIDDQGPMLYDIEIVKLLPQDKPSAKSMIIKVTDQRLLAKTGGIVQGMSGSPIIQNNKIVGAVTHVLVNKPDVGYGIYIEWMLKDAEIVK